MAQLPNEDGTVEISYTLPEDTENVFVGLWNKFVFHVRTLVSEKKQTRGRHTIVWDGKDDQGNPAGPESLSAGVHRRRTGSQPINTVRGCLV